MNIDFQQIQIDTEGGPNRRDISELSPCELGEIIWKHKSGYSTESIASSLRAKLWQVSNYIKSVRKGAGEYQNG